MPHRTLSTRNDNEQKIDYDWPYIHCIISFENSSYKNLKNTATRSFISCFY